MTKVTSGFAIVALVVIAWIGIALTTGTSRVRAFNSTVTNLDDSGDGSLRQAILDANALFGADTIDFQDELAGTITLTSGQLPAISEDLTINGPGTFSIIVSGNQASRVFEINSGVTVGISGLTISDGTLMGTTARGGGILNNGTLTLTNVVLSGNTTSTVPPGSGLDGGGAIFNNGILIITNCTLSDNSAGGGDGGGILNNAGRSLSVTNTTLSRNIADVGGGGGISNYGTLSIINSTLSGNSSISGGGIGNSGTANISFSTLAANSITSSNGGGIFTFGGTINIKNSIVANNTPSDCSNVSGGFNATGVNFTTNGTCPGFTVVTPAQLNLGPLQNNGGNTETHALLGGSVAINAAPDCTDVFGNPGSPKVGAPRALVTTDQRGVGRPQGSACDVGSYEFVPCTTAPTVICPESFTASTDATHCSAVIAFKAAANCPCENGGGNKPLPSKGVGGKAPVSPTQGCMVSCAPASGATFPRGTTTVSCTASDSFGNTSEPCSFTITVTDQTPPAVSCPANIVKSTDPNQCSTTASYTATAVDNCDGPLTPTCTPASGSTFQKGVTTVTCTATDSSKNTGGCSFTVTVNDTQPPSITCPANITTNAGPNQCSAVVTYPPPTVSDNCPDVGTPTCSPASGSTFPKGTTTVTCSVSDTSNNIAGCTFTVTVQDTQPPTITCPANIVRCNDTNQCGAIVTFSPTVNDNCPSPTALCSPAAGSFFPKGTTTVTCTATDASGNQSSPCSFTVTVNDCQNPTITCPANVTRGTDPNQCSAVVTYPPPTVSDNCQGVGAPTCAPASGSMFVKGTTTVTCSVTDASNNSASCSFTVTVNDTQRPSITCPANVTQNAAPNQCSAVITYPPPTVSDNCPNVGTPTCSPASGSTFPVGTTTVTCSVSDASNNIASCSFTVTVRDLQPPTITCPPNITFVTAATCPPTNNSMPVNFTVTATDNCGPVTVVCRNQNGVVVTSGQPFPIGTTTVTCTATDASGNTGSCSFTISGFSFCLQDDVNPGNVVLINAVTGDYRFCCSGVLVATGTGTVTTRGCIGSIDDAKGARRVHIQWDTSANGVGAGTAIVQVSPNKTVCQITDMKMTDNTCSCSNPQPAGKEK